MTFDRTTTGRSLSRVGAALLTATMAVAGAGAAHARAGSSSSSTPQESAMTVEGRGADARVTLANTTDADGFGGEQWVLTDASFAPSAFVYCENAAGATTGMALKSVDGEGGTGSLTLGSLGTLTVSGQSS